MASYLDLTGLSHFWDKAKTYILSAYTSKSAASGGTDVSLVTTGEKYTWNNKSNLSLGTSSSTAYRGDYGNTAYTHATDSGRLTTAKSSGLYKISTTAHGHVGSVTAVAKSDITGLGIPASDTWRGIQDNLTSSSNTTESLSAKQGYLLANGSARDDTKLPLAGGTMTGAINLAENNVGWNFRAANNGYYTTASYQTSGNEALVFASKQGVTSFMFVNGEDSVTNHNSDRWTSLTPGLQIKNNKVSIGKLIANNVTPTYPLDVNGTVNATDFKVNAKVTLQYNTTDDCLNFVFA